MNTVILLKIKNLYVENVEAFITELIKVRNVINVEVNYIGIDFILIIIYNKKG